MRTKEERLQDLERLKTMTREEVAEFWDTHDFTDYTEFLQEVKVTATPRSWKEPFTLRLDSADVDELKSIAEDKGIGATTLVRMIVKDWLKSGRKLSTKME